MIIKCLRKVLIGLALILGTVPSFSETATPTTLLPPYVQSDYDNELQAFWQQSAAKNPIFIQRLQAASAWLLGKPYQLFPNGEGEAGSIDQAPLYRSDRFDCTTYVVTTIAMAESQDLASFKQHYQKLMYEQGQVDFFHRNHFASIDFNANNEKTGVLSDITETLTVKGKPVTKVLNNTINKPSWYKKIGLTRVRLLKAPSASDLAHIGGLLKQYQLKSKSELVAVDYIPLNLLVSAHGEINGNLLKQIPQGSILEVVYADPQDRIKLGTDLQIAHMGFIFKTAQGQVFREASSAYGEVIDVPLNNYLRGLRANPNILGVHIEQVNQ